MYKRPTGEVVETGREARQGYLDRPVLVVVAVGTVLALGGMLLAWMFVS